MPKSRPLLDLRAFRRKEDRRLALVIIVFLVVVGGAVIGLVYGWQTAMVSFFCLIGGGSLFGLLWLILALIERWAKRDE